MTPTNTKRRRLWSTNCQYCGTRWHKARSNYLIESSRVCLFCHQALNKAVERGAAWIIKRRQTLNVWDSRLASVTGTKVQPISTAKKRRKRATQ